MEDGHTFGASLYEGKRLCKVDYDSVNSLLQRIADIKWVAADVQY